MDKTVNRVFVSVEEGREEPAWLERVEPFLQAVLTKLGYSGLELSVMFCGAASVLVC